MSWQTLPLAFQPMEVLTQRQLNRSLLARQLLLERVRRPGFEVIEHLVGMQAQVPSDPYTALWSRIEDFDPAELSTLIEERRAVRATALLRTTIHLVSARDCLVIRGVMQPVLERQFRYSPFARALPDVDVDDVVAAGLDILAERPMTMSALGRRLEERWPGRDPTALSYAIRYLVPLVQVPPRGLWGRGGQPVSDTVESWLGAAVESAPSLDDLVLRYLAAFGPATAKDVQVWSWLSGIREVLERLRPRLRTFRDGAGRELFDVPDGPMPDPDTPAPVRFLPEYDNIALSHDDRTRIIDRQFGVDRWMRGSVLVDGFVRGTWRLDGKRDAVLAVRLFDVADNSQRTDVEDEAGRLLGFLAPGAQTRDLRFVD
jgi:hypothetical protein